MLRRPKAKNKGPEGPWRTVAQGQSGLLAAVVAAARHETDGGETGQHQRIGFGFVFYH